MINYIVIKCPTYKESFMLRKALIELNINWANDLKLSNKSSNWRFWKGKWEQHKTNCAYIIEKNKLYIGCILKNDNYISVKDFIKKYIK